MGEWGGRQENGGRRMDGFFRQDGRMGRIYSILEGGGEGLTRRHWGTKDVDGG
jgi:hypothetical protein